MPTFKHALEQARRPLSRRAAAAISASMLAACVTTPPAPKAPQVWEQRLPALQQASAWDLAGRAAVAIGTQGWQAGLNWRQRGQSSEVHISGPLGVGASALRLTPAGLSLDGAPPGSDALTQLQDRLGFDLPLRDMRYWLLGVPAPEEAFVLVRNAEDRVQHLEQAGWRIDIDRYLPNTGDWLPGHLTLNHGDVRVRIVVDRWDLLR